jgi:hypothetical protein
VGDFWIGEQEGSTNSARLQPSFPGATPFSQKAATSAIPLLFLFGGEFKSFTFQQVSLAASQSSNQSLLYDQNLFCLLQKSI